MQIVTRQPLTPDNIEWMEKDRNSQGVNALKDRQEWGIAELFSPHVRAEINAPAAKLCDRPLRLRDRRRGILHGKRR